MIVNFPYEWADSLDSKGYNVLGIYSPAYDINLKTGPSLTEAFEKPFGTQALKDQVRCLPADKRRVLIITDDITRNTPVKDLLPEILKELAKGGIGKEDIQVLIGNGLHRPMTDHEIQKHFGLEISRSIRIINHNAGNRHDLANLGTMPDGTKIEINRLAVENDFVISLGQIAPHRVAGFSGGSKMIQPGVSGNEITKYIHWQGWLEDTSKIFGRRDNPIRHNMDMIAEKVGLDFIINVVMKLDDTIYGIYAGDFIEAHKKGCWAALSIYSTVVKRADIVIIDSYPCDMDLWQAAKAATPAEIVMKEGGSVILVTPCPEGISSTHPEIKEIGYRSYTEIIKGVRNNTIKDKIVAAHLLAFGRILEKGKVILVSPGFKQGEVLEFGLDYAATVKEALDREIRRIGSSATISILNHGGKIFPVISE